MERGKFIVFEGGDGVGKSTQIKKLKEYLLDHNIPLITSREPGGSDGAESIRPLLVCGDDNRWDGLSELYLLLAARHDHITKTILPALNAGKWVLCDRFHLSSLVYQGYGRGLNLQLINDISAPVIEQCHPDITFILDIDEKTALQRGKNTAKDEQRFENIGLAFHARLREGFLHFAQSDPDKYALIDANFPPDIVFDNITQKIAPLM